MPAGDGSVADEIAAEGGVLGGREAVGDGVAEQVVLEGAAAGGAPAVDEVNGYLRKRRGACGWDKAEEVAAAAKRTGADRNRGAGGIDGISIGIAEAPRQIDGRRSRAQPEIGEERRQSGQPIETCGERRRSDQREIVHPPAARTRGIE